MGLGAEGGVAFGRTLEKRVPIKILNIWSNAIGPVGTCALARGIVASGHLQTLILKVRECNTLPFNACSQYPVGQGNFIGADGMRDLCSALEGNLTVTTLDVSGNRLGIEGSTVLGNLLSVNQQLKSVNVSGNNLDNEGVHRIFEGMRNNGLASSLRHLFR